MDYLSDILLEHDRLPLFVRRPVYKTREILLLSPSQFHNRHVPCDVYLDCVSGSLHLFLGLYIVVDQYRDVQSEERPCYPTRGPRGRRKVACVCPSKGRR